MRSPITARQEGPILFLDIETQGSAVNIFNKPLADSIHRIFDEINPSKTQLIVFQSKKPYSFLNGAELILTQSMKTLEDVFALTSNTKAAYEKVAQCPIPTVAAIEGNCFGCGVEFTLCCDYRVSSDSFDSRFYMTELRDYCLLPLFGSIEKLPRLMGFKLAIDFLLKAEVWTAKKAYRNGLIDAVFPMDRFPNDLDDFLHTLLNQGPKKRNLSQSSTSHPILQADKSDVAEVRDWISKLPSDQIDLHNLCLEMMIKASLPQNQSSPSMVSEAAPKNLLSTLSTESSRNATAFFFLRTMARVANLGTSTVAPDRRLEIIFDSSLAPAPFFKILETRPLRYLKLVREYRLGHSGVIQKKENVNNPVIVISDPKTRESFSCRICWGFQPNPTTDQEMTLYFPKGSETDLCEVFLLGSLSPIHTSFLLLLGQLGWQALVNRDKTSVVNPYFQIYESNLPSVKDASNPWPLLYAQAQKDLNEKRIKHRSIIDVLIHSAFKFPLSNGSFTEFMQKQEIS